MIAVWYLEVCNTSGLEHIRDVEERRPRIVNVLDNIIAGDNIERITKLGQLFRASRVP